ncbi:autotransporter outer membrane beta-barrel domain-containing protein [Planktomarina temperata]|nr:autotransporter outer membrane beta-barrel domain-containing protein [Planktomarina temperata]
MSQATSVISNSRKSVLLGTSALVCLALAAPVMADDFTITSGATTNDGNTVNGNDTVAVTGALVTTGANYGIETTGGTNTVSVSNTGSITTGTGTFAYGIYNLGSTNTTTVSGSIKTSGAFGVGIRNDGNNNTTTVSGSIKTAGRIGYGILNYGDDNATTVSGSITTEGTEGLGIFSMGSNNSVTISGTVSTTNSIYGALVSRYGTGNSFTLNEGATIIGDITARVDGINNKLTLNLGQDKTYAYSVGGKGVGTGGGQWTYTDQDGRTPVISTNGTSCAGETDVTVCNLVTGVSTGNLEAQDELQFSMNSSMIGSLELGSSNSAAPTKAMSSTQTPQSNAWFNIYGDTSERSTSTTKLAFEGSNRGLTIRTPVAISDTLNLDVVFNASNANLDIGSAKEQKITVESYNIGAVLRDLVPSDAWSVDAFGFLGSNSYDGKRKVMNNDTLTGSETVTASYSGMEVLLGVDAQYSKPINDTLNFIGGLNASLSNEKIGAYSESKYYAWNARTMLQTAGGINLGLEYNKDALTTFASLGLQHSSLQKGKTATFTNNGTAGSFIDNATSDTRRSATVGFSYKASDNIAFKGAVEAFTSENGVDGNSANLSANWSF